jgi:hypothetical protein
VLGLALLVSPAIAQTLAPVPADRAFEVLDGAADLRTRMRQAAEGLGTWSVTVAGVELDGPTLEKLADSHTDHAFTRVVREALRRPFDVEDLLLFLDDVLVAGAAGRRGEPFVVPMGRARSEGILVHPQEVWGDRPRDYPQSATVAVDEPPPQDSFPPAADGDVLGPGWTMRYRSPEGREAMLQALADKRPGATFAARITSLLDQLEAQKAEVTLTSTLRYRERGYLMWGAFLLRSCEDRACVDDTVARLDAIQGTWVTVPVVWRQPEGWEATREAARQTADAFDVVYATEKGARESNHYDGLAADLVAVGLPRHLRLKAPDGARRRFDLAHPAETRDLSLTPVVVRWIEEHWDLKKLRDDYPHWDDTETSE